MRAIWAWIIAMVSWLTVMSSSRIWCTNSPTRSLARTFWLSSRASLPLAMIWSSSGSSAVVVAAAVAASGWAPASGGVLLAAIAGSSRGGGFLDLLLALGVGGHVLQQGVEVVVAVELREQVVQALARLEQLAQRLELLHDALGTQILDFPEVELDAELARVLPFLELVVDVEGQARSDRAHDLVEVVAVELDELALLERRQRLLGLAREVGQDAHDERQLLHLDRAAELDIVGDLNARRPHAAQLFLGALGHSLLLSKSSALDAEQGVEGREIGILGEQLLEQLGETEVPPRDGAPHQVGHGAVGLGAHQVVGGRSELLVGLRAAGDGDRGRRARGWGGAGRAAGRARQGGGGGSGGGGGGRISGRGG